MRRRIGANLGWAFLVACLVACSLTVSTAWTLGYGGGRRAAAVGLHSGRVAFVYHDPSFLDPGLIAGAERAVPSTRNFLLPYVMTGRRTVISVPLYVPMTVAGCLMAWRRQTHRRRPRGFAVVTAADGGGGGSR